MIYDLDNELYDNGYKLILGIDEVGRGAIAGPLVVCSVILPQFIKINGLDDSKKLSPKKRVELYKEIKEKALAINVIFKSEDEVDRLNIYACTKLAMEESYFKSKIKPDYVLVDAMPLNIDAPYEAIIKGDQKSASIAAASICAKVIRDYYMEKMDLKYNGYGFKKHKGYCTKLHMEKLDELGPCKIHRKTFYPVSKYYKEFVQTKLDI